MWKNLPYKSCVYFSIVINFISVVLILTLKSTLPPVVPLFYGLPSGAEQLAPALGLTFAPASGLVITVLNLFLSSLTRDVFLKKTLVISSAFVSLLLAITVTKIFLLVGFF
jgi:hypothetical protein